MSDFIFKIYGGNNQILPNATKAEQNFYGDKFAEQVLAKQNEQTSSEKFSTVAEPESPSFELTEDEKRLSIYINKVETLQDYISKLHSCQTAGALAEVVATMCQDEQAITEELIVKEKFINLLLPFVPEWEKGRTIDNIRAAINKVWAVRKKANRQVGR